MWLEPDRKRDTGTAIMPSLKVGQLPHVFACVHQYAKKKQGGASTPPTLHLASFTVMLLDHLYRQHQDQGLITVTGGPDHQFFAVPGFKIRLYRAITEFERESIQSNGWRS